MACRIKFKDLNPKQLTWEQMLIPDQELCQLGKYVSDQLKSQNLKLQANQMHLFNSKQQAGVLTLALVKQWLQTLNHVKLPSDNERLCRNLAEFALLLRNAYDHAQGLQWEGSGFHG